jgi:hypothetical protein
MPNCSRTWARLAGSKDRVVKSSPFGMTVILRAGTPQCTSRSRTTSATAMVASEVSSDARYRARTEALIFRRSIWVSPMECSVVTMTGVRASRAAGRA